MAEETKNLKDYAGDLAAATTDLTAQTANFELVRTALAQLAAYAQNNAQSVNGLPVVVISGQGRDENTRITIDLNAVGAAAAVTLVPFLEMVAGFVGTSLQQSWGRVQQINSQAQSILELANRARQAQEMQERTQQR